MWEGFIAVFVTALVFTIFAFLTLQTDAEDPENVRPIYLFAFAIAAWFISIPLLIAPFSTTTYYPPTNVIQGNVITQYAAYNVTTTSSTPVGAMGFDSYTLFASAMISVLTLVLVIFILNRAKQLTLKAKGD